ncbi:MAG: hypothetical protein H7837_07235 [Magnetococcus sp. MYC-9]
MLDTAFVKHHGAKVSRLHPLIDKELSEEMEQMACTIPMVHDKLLKLGKLAGCVQLTGNFKEFLHR